MLAKPIIYNTIADVLRFPWQKPEVEDLTTVGMLRFMKAIGRIDSTKSFDGYCATIGRNLGRDHIRRLRAKQCALSLDELVLEPGTSDTDPQWAVLDTAAADRIVDHLLDKGMNEHFLRVICVKAQGNTLDETAEILQITRATAHSRFFRGGKFARQALADFDPDR